MNRHKFGPSLDPAGGSRFITQPFVNVPSVSSGDCTSPAKAGLVVDAGWGACACVSRLQSPCLWCSVGSYPIYFEISVSKHAVSLCTCKWTSAVLADGGLVGLWRFYSRNLDSYKSSNRN